MKRAVAIVLSLILVWIQAVAAVQPTAAAPPAKCGCCACKKMDCCVGRSTSESQPLPVAPVPAAAQNHFSAVLSTLVAWTLPAPTPAQVSSFDSAPTSALAVPLFQRDCALLI